MGTWINAKQHGVRYRVHETRKFKRQKDKYFAIRYQNNGRRIEESLGWLSDGMTAEEAAAIRGMIVQNIKKGVSPQSVAEMREIKERAVLAEKEKAEAAKRAALTFGEAADLFLKWSKVNKKSYDGDKSRYENHIEKRFKSIPIKNLSPFHLEKLKSALKKKGLSQSTITQCLQLVRVIFNKTRAWGKHDCEFPKVDFPNVSNQRVTFLSKDHARDLLAAVKKKSIPLWGQCVLGLYAGLRFGEIAALELSDIDKDAGTIHIRDGKGGTRHAYLTKPIEAMLDDYWTVVDKKPGLIFPARTGGQKDRVSPVYFRTVKELGFNDGITDRRQKVVFHTLRHSFASWLVMGGEGLQTVQELMGHKDIKTTMRYAHLAPSVKRDAVKNLVETLKPGDKAKLKAVK